MDVDSICLGGQDSAGIASDRRGVDACLSDWMGLLTAVEFVPFAVPLLIVGDRILQIAGVCGRRTVDLLGGGDGSGGLVVRLVVHWLYFVGFVIGAVNTTAGSAAQNVLTRSPANAWSRHMPRTRWQPRRRR